MRRRHSWPHGRRDRYDPISIVRFAEARSIWATSISRSAGLIHGHADVTNDMAPYQSRRRRRHSRARGRHERYDPISIAASPAPFVASPAPRSMWPHINRGVDDAIHGFAGATIDMVP